MADGKKSFVLYCDIIKTVELLTNEQAGKLFKTILEYVNDNNPEVQDILTAVAFEPIKQQLKRDLTEWEQEKIRRSEAGKKGMDSRWHNKDKSVITKHNTTIKPITNITDNVTVNDNVNVNDIVIPYRIEECLQISLNDERWVRANKTNREELEIFNGYLEQVSEYSKNPLDYKRHFARFKRKYPDQFKPNAKPMSIEDFRKLAQEQDKNNAA